MTTENMQKELREKQHAFNTSRHVAKEEVRFLGQEIHSFEKEKHYLHIAELSLNHQILELKKSEHIVRKIEQIVMRMRAELLICEHKVKEATVRPLNEHDKAELKTSYMRYHLHFKELKRFLDAYSHELYKAREEEGKTYQINHMLNTEYAELIKRMGLISVDIQRLLRIYNN
jgi:hypothetical protein